MASRCHLGKTVRLLNKLIFIFIDGLGIGQNNPQINPMAKFYPDYLSHFLNIPDKPDKYDGLIIPTDASLGLPGLPQSATGQTTLLTGVNTATILNRHLSGFPNRVLRDHIKTYSLLKQLKEKNIKGGFLNTFRPEFFDLDERNKWRMSATTLTNLAADLPFFTIEDLRNHQAVYQDITNETLINRGYSVPHFTPEEAGQIMVNQLDNLDFILFEFFQTDRAGHKQEMNIATKELDKLNRLIGSILHHLDLKKNTLIISSDHGNIEDLSIKSHTNNAVMTKVWGTEKINFKKRITKLEDITQSVMKYFTS